MEEGRMTSVALTEQASTARRRMPNRITAVFRLHFVTIATTIAVPWLILAIIFAANYVIWWIIARSVSDPADLADAQEGFSYSGATFYIFVYMMIVAVQAINLTFAFAQGYSVTRRDFYLGTSLAFVALAVMYAAGLTVLSYLEEVTGGWGLGGRKRRMVRAIPALPRDLPVLLLRGGGDGDGLRALALPRDGGSLRRADPRARRGRRARHPDGELGRGRRVVRAQRRQRCHPLVAGAHGRLRGRRVLRAAAGDAPQLMRDVAAPVYR
jgi:hypothetical protein